MLKTYLFDSDEPRKYWSVLKLRLKNEGSELTTKCSQLKLKAKDGKFYNTDVLDTKGILRLIESIPSPKWKCFAQNDINFKGIIDFNEERLCKIIYY